MTERSVSSASDFPNLAVYRRDEPQGPVYSIVFEHFEYPEGWKSTLRGLGFLVVLFGFFFGGVFYLNDLVGPIWALIWLMTVTAYFFWARVPWTTARRIEVDTGSDRIRVMKKDLVELERQLSGMSLTVEDHPDAEYKRQSRQERGVKRLSYEEKQHCLVGWFGARGAERVILLSRAEWPCRRSLLEVREAIFWAAEGAGGRVVPADDPGAPQTESIRPPLD